MRVETRVTTLRFHDKVATSIGICSPFRGMGGRFARRCVENLEFRLISGLGEGEWK